MRSLSFLSLILLTAFSLQGCSGGLFSSKAPVTLTEAWATDNTLRTPESVVFDRERNVLYVSNINQTSKDRKDGDGFISKLNPNGDVDQLYWVSGLNDPKGMALHNNILYVADMDEIIAIATQTGAVLARHKADKAQMLNDVTVDNAGNVYVSDSQRGAIYLFRNGRVSHWLDTKRERPNGLLYDNNRLIVASFNTGKVRFLDTERQDFTDWTDKIPSADGIARVGTDGTLVSNWNGEIYYVDINGRNWKILDTKNKKINAADIFYSEEQGMLYVPTFLDNRVVAYRVTF
ncbi:gluconolaconase [Pontibacter sp. HSC-14F20]|uniref:SMP-30/gluconolactonase/LRE family protein n=1 Tax=Pontibacter sp. HSC-14F20 TaxID=2864136 RepID=UPI001C7327E0|nr:gluconolaconase [Pontibacter sp. HSC-14F20]MBX0331783.1 gluconolaconase [Pontibacter sp. HSC-14F20]